jgi:hypothetical protein
VDIVLRIDVEDIGLSSRVGRRDDSLCIGAKISELQPYDFIRTASVNFIKSGHKTTSAIEIKLSTVWGSNKWSHRHPKYRDQLQF